MIKIKKTPCMTGCLDERTGGKIRSEIDVLYTGV